MRVLVCGGRDYKDRRKVYETLDGIGISRLVCGGAKGADQLALDWAATRQVDHHAYIADWESYGRAAGPLRNQEMLDVELPDLVVAFLGNYGTADMIRRAELAAVPVRKVK